MAAVGDARKRQQEEAAAAAHAAKGEPGPVEIEVGITADPAGYTSVMLQLPSGWVTMDAASARATSAALAKAADAIDPQAGDRVPECRVVQAAPVATAGQGAS